jgi:hypothetical protein
MAGTWLLCASPTFFLAGGSFLKGGEQLLPSRPFIK